MLVSVKINGKKEVPLPKKGQIPKQLHKCNSPSGFSIYEYDNLVFSS